MAVTYENGIWSGEVQPLQQDWPRYRQILLERLKKFPDRVSQIDATNDRKDTYAQLTDRVIRCSLWLKEQNLKADDIVAVCSYRHLDTIVPFVASILTGVTVHPWWDATLTDDTVKHFLNLTNPKIIFADETKIDKIKKIVDEVGAKTRIIAFNGAPNYETLDDIMKSQKVEEVESFECEILNDICQPALIMCTSGTTGYPKGILLPYSRLMVTMMPISETSTNYFLPAGINWVTGVSNSLQMIFTCTTAIIHPCPNERIILEIIEKYKIASIPGLNTAYAIRMWVSDMVKNYDVSSLKMVTTTGSAMPPEADEYMFKNFGHARVMNGYGCTELTWLTLRPNWTKKPSSCGFVSPNVQLKIVDVNTGKTLGIGEEGEIWAKYPYGMLGYYNNPEATKAVFDDEGWYHTGDIAYYDEDGEFFIVDRLKDLIKFRMNYHYPPSMIEKVILKCPGVFEVAVVAKPHVEDIEQPMAFVSILPNSKTTEQNIIDIVSQHLPDHMHLRGGVVILDQLPRTENQKVTKKELKKMIALAI